MSQSAHHYAASVLGAHEPGDSNGSLTSTIAAPSLTTVLLQGVPRLSKLGRALLWTDAAAGVAAGTMLLVGRSFLADWFGLPVEVVAFNGIANWTYASYSGTLAALTALGVTPSRRALATLVFANTAWALVCAGIVRRNWDSVTGWGIGYLALEAACVAVLAVVEYRVLLRWPQK